MTFNVIIEIPMNADPVKYEVDKESGAIFVDRFMSTAMHYPTNYGYVPKTLSGDGDPVDVLVITPVPLIPGVVVPCRAIGILKMEDEAGVDGKVLAVPTNKILSLYTRWQEAGRPEPDPPEDDCPLLRALQGPGRRQVGQDSGLGRPRRGHQGNHGRHRQLQQGARLIFR
jgi:hypothetical protein